HLAAILKFTPELEDVESLRMAIEMADYGRQLAPMFHFREDPPFENTYDDYAIYLRALLGEDVDRAIEHFSSKVGDFSSPLRDTAPAEVLIELLTRLGRYDEAIQASLQSLRGVDSRGLSCPSAIQLCQIAGNYSQLRDIARQDGE